MPAPGGNWRVGKGFLSSSICTAEKLTKSANNKASACGGSALATCAPISEPSMMPGAKSLTTGHSTAPRW